MNIYEYIDNNNLYQEIIDVIYDDLIPLGLGITATEYRNFQDEDQEKLYYLEDGEYLFEVIEENIKYPIYYVPIDMLIDRKYIKTLNLVIGQKFKNYEGFTDADIEKFAKERFNTLKRFSHRTLSANEHDFIVAHYDYFYGYIYNYTTSVYKDNYNE